MIATMMLAQAMVATIDYRVSVAAGPVAPVVTVDMTFPGDDDGETDVDLPEKWAGSGELWRSLKLLGVDGGEVVGSPDPAHWRVRHQPGRAADRPLLGRRRPTRRAGRGDVRESAPGDRARLAVDPQPECDRDPARPRECAGDLRLRPDRAAAGR